MGVVVATLRGLVLLAAIGCGGSRTPRTTDKGPSIIVLDPGSEPRQLLRYAPRVHAPEQFTMSLKLSVDTAFTNTVLERGQRTNDFPTIVITGRIEVMSLSDRGDAAVTYAIEKATVLDDVSDARARAFGTALRALEGRRASWQMTPSGSISDVRVDVPVAGSAVRDQSAQVAESLHASIVVFPDAMVGPGASWRVTSRVTLGRVMWNRTATYRLRQLADSTAIIDADVVMHAPSQALQVEPNSSTKLTSGKSSATAELVIPLHGLVWTATSHAITEANYSIVSRTLRIISRVQTDAEFSVKPSASPQP